MKKGVFFVAVAGCISFSILFSSCGPPISGKSTSDDRKITSFMGIDIDAPVNCKITVQQGSQPSIQLNGPENLLKLIKTDVRDNVLHIESEDNFRMDWTDEVNVVITTASLDEIDMSGAGSTEVNGNITVPNFEADVSGVGKLNLAQISVDTMNINVSGAGKFKIASGTVKYANYDLSGAGMIDAFGVVCENANADMSGAGSINLNATTALTTSLSGVGSIRYKGHPQITADNSGIGKVMDAN